MKKNNSNRIHAKCLKELSIAYQTDNKAGYVYCDKCKEIVYQRGTNDKG